MLSSFTFCAIVKTWMDQDVIEATVRNAISQGADAVYVVDNGSTDDTVAIAEATGANVAEIYQTDVFDGRMAQVLMNAVVAGRVAPPPGQAHLVALPGQRRVSRRARRLVDS